MSLKNIVSSDFCSMLETDELDLFGSTSHHFNGRLHVRAKISNVENAIFLLLIPNYMRRILILTCGGLYS